MDRLGSEVSDAKPPEPPGRLAAATTFRLPAEPSALSRNAYSVPQTSSFYARHFPLAGPAEVGDWRWHLAHRVTRPEDLARFITLPQGLLEGLSTAGRCLPMSVTPYYLSLLDPSNPTDPLRRCVIPSPREAESSPGEEADPLGEEHDSPVPGLVHRYPDRVLFLATETCSTYCRYCTRSRRVGRAVVGPALAERWEAGLEYIARSPSVRDVLISGGDPLTLPDEMLDSLLSRLRRIPHVEVVRIGTKVPAVLPQRVTRDLTAMLRQHHPLFMSLHFAHPRELTPETAEACARLADAGIPLGSQTVLLAGVNDDVETMRRLFTGLMRLRVRPYYLYQCDPIPGSAHFRTPVRKGLEIIQGLRGHISGYAVPNFVIDAPGGGGKIPLLPDSVLGRDAEGLQLVNFAGKVCHYPDLVDPAAL